MQWQNFKRAYAHTQTSAVYCEWVVTRRIRTSEVCECSIELLLSDELLDFFATATLRLLVKTAASKRKEQ